MAGTTPGTGTGVTVTPKANVLPTVPGHTVKEVTLPRSNSYSGIAPYSIKSETYDPLASNY